MEPTAGDVQVRITAAKDGVRAGIISTQHLSESAKSDSGSPRMGRGFGGKLLMVGLIAAAAAGGGLAAVAVRSRTAASAPAGSSPTPNHHDRPANNHRRSPAMKILVLIALFATATLQAQLLEPRIGVALGGDRTLLEVRGLSANFIVDRTGVPAEDAACSIQFCAIQVDGNVRILDATTLSRIAAPRAGHRRTPSVQARGLAEIDAGDAVFGFSHDRASRFSGRN